MQGPILTPAAVLVLWTMVMLLWMGFTRLPAIAKMGGLAKAKPGGRGQDLEGVLPDQINWKSHNYAHLMEQPTLFYAAVVILAIMGAGQLDVTLAWAYVVIRIVHSIWQATVNRLPVRFTLFLLSSLCLIVLAIRALGATMGHG
ncbi:MAPEG family protein [Novosphingobium sp. SL115]|uniref:MAPEG family protein n=1 Tax=Novosphingobium sp. SL115 TaxID=2995150 RepID=UPI002272CEB8|nr:MAPEG family protein [Novosphingobium sp. SL115]MCY1671862.1 MAPEG family protein [Novosphingobium sp. SL115]